MAMTPISQTPGLLAEAMVDLGAIEHNVRVLREHAGHAQLMAVVKADGYGHGATRVAQTALGAGAAELGVATVDEALALRADGITAPVLAWLHPPGIDFGPALLADVQVAVSSLRQLDELLHAVRRTGRTATVTVKVDTGLNRNGVGPAQFPAMLTALRQAMAEDAVRLRGLMSHMVYADKPDDSINDVQALTVYRLSGAGPRTRGAVRGGASIELISNYGAPRPDVRPGAAGHRGVWAKPGTRPR